MPEEKETEDEKPKEEKVEEKAGAEEENNEDKSKDENLPKDKEVKKVPKHAVDVEGWDTKTSIGRKVRSGEIKDIDEILDKGICILEPEITEILLPGLETDLLLVGQSKGKFGGGQKRVFKQTQKKTQEGNKPKFATFAIAGNKNGYIGIGYGKSKETVPAREKALRNAKLNIMKIRRGCGSWECGCREPHTIPFAVEGKCSSARIKLMPAPKGTGLVVEPECQKILAMVGIKDIWSKTGGQTGTKTNLIFACFDALKKLVSTKVKPDLIENLGIIEGKAQGEEAEEEKVQPKENQEKSKGSESSKKKTEKAEDNAAKKGKKDTEEGEKDEQ
ncbi:30S ribosomal protein S5 [Candidatus Woesearchaeota archaeon]|nr:30S ribosomal protein S5 [Candidatus Woesearchaeota archaeon]